MSKISKIVNKNREIELKKPVINFMDGISYELNPLETLKMISASSIFGEPQYYRNSGIKDDRYDGDDAYVAKYSIFGVPKGISASELMINAINNSLNYDYIKTLQWAKELRNSYYMRLNPQIIMVLAAMHPKRLEFTKEYPGMFSEINKQIMKRADEPASQLAFYLYYNQSKKKLPSILKRSWCDKLQHLSRYEIAKYKNSELGMIDTVRICHAHSPLIDELMTKGQIDITEDEQTWQNLRSQQISFKEIVTRIKMPHMALLRNLRNIFKELTSDDIELAKKLLNDLKNGVLTGKQLPFRYYSALKIIQKDEQVNFKGLLIDALEECIDISINNMPKLKGKTICLSDNSGSAWGAFASEYGTVTVADIDNLSSVITAANSDEGYIGKFGDDLKIIPVSKRNGILTQSINISANKHNDVGGGTENGIWIFFKNAITNKEYYDNIFIYSDMQAGHGGLYGYSKETPYNINDISYACRGKYVDVMKLINTYRSQINPKVNVFCIQTAGYDNVVIPEYIYRGAVLYGWTGKEAIFATELIQQWDEIEKHGIAKN